MSKIEELISEIEDYIDSCKAQPFSNNKKIIVDKDIIDDLLVDLRLRVPDEIKNIRKSSAAETRFFPMPRQKPTAC